MKKFFSLLLALSLALPVLGLAGCDTDKEVMDVETPRGEVEVEQDRDTGALEVDD
jgi:hypothetical protein